MTVMEFITYLSCSDQAAVDGLTNACGSNRRGLRTLVERARA